MTRPIAISTEGRPTLNAHERICKALDAAAEEGLLGANDTCGYYMHRDWSQNAEIVNRETTVAHVVGGLLRPGVKEAQKAGMRIEDVSDPATRNHNLVQAPKKGSEPRGL
jgi:hypothetical protein